LLCEMCGRDFPGLRSVRVEGTPLKVCSECARFGDENVAATSGGTLSVHSTVADRLDHRDKRMTSKDVFNQFKGELVEDYSARLKSARLSRGWTPEDLGKKINEKKSVIHKLETGELRPDNKLVVKLQRTLEIVLKEDVEEVHVGRKSHGDGLTLGDLIKIQKE